MFDFVIFDFVIFELVAFVFIIARVQEMTTWKPEGECRDKSVGFPWFPQWFNRFSSGAYTQWGQVSL